MYGADAPHTAEYQIYIYTGEATDSCITIGLSTETGALSFCSGLGSTRSGSRSIAVLVYRCALPRAVSTETAVASLHVVRLYYLLLVLWPLGLILVLVLVTYTRCTYNV